ncbi:MAG TPA: DUF4339 domain-containing protein [Pirellulales bacterium]|jgi:hypothetical protein|nr:DUF4339 domain-containing protein [Pirellulales bacterium]
MAKKKEGDLRLLKDGVIFGPTGRAGLDKLLSTGRITPQDRVSLRNAEWISIADFLAIPAPSPEAARPPGAAASPAPAEPLAAMPPAAAPSTTEASAPPAPPRKKTGDLRVIKGGRMVNALTRNDVAQLTATGHVGDDDLVCALDGPWMRVGDFLSTRARGESSRPQPPAAGAATAEEPRETGSPGADPSRGVAASRPVSSSAEIREGEGMVVMAGRVEVMQSKETLPGLVEPMAVVGKSNPAVTYKVSSVTREKKSDLDDQWYVRIRAMSSAPLAKRHLKALYQSREITSESMARHPKWDENDWRPIHSIPELAELSRP